ncbi:MAG TPA: adenosine kinase [Acidimicrobiales bacterium]|nr:adenosine kinase [Acidimicrobiales bacterium]
MATFDLDVLAVGSAIVDNLALVTDEELADAGLAKGSMTLVDAEEAASLWDAVAGARVAGGSAANTAVGVSSLGGRAAFAGRVADDPVGDLFRTDLRSVGVDFLSSPPVAGGSSGRCTILVTPDGERTMRTHLGSAPMLHGPSLTAAALARARYVYLEGYLWDSPDAAGVAEAAMAAAREQGAGVALSLSDPGCVERHASEFTALLDGGAVDAVFCNEDEAAALTGTADLDRVVGWLAARCQVATVTRGSRGAEVAAGDMVWQVPARAASVVDTTGAGDYYAAGFLFALCRGWTPEDCARLGNLAAAEVISVLGARPPAPLVGVVAEARRA